MTQKQSNVQKTVNIAVILCESSHVFCCVLPTAFSAISLMVGLGVVSAMPVWLNGLHDVMHEWEVPMIVLSGIVIAFGWWLHAYAQKVECHADGCHHDHGKKKQGLFESASWILKGATLLFFFNVLIYFALHRPEQVVHQHEVIERQHDAGHEGHAH